jgi:hypothetical protein
MLRINDVLTDPDSLDYNSAKLRKGVSLNYVQLHRPFSVEIAGRKEVGQAGDYLLRDSDGYCFVTSSYVAKLLFGWKEE